MDFPGDFPFAVGALGAEDEVAPGDGIRGFGFIFGDDGDFVDAMLADGVCADVAILGMEFDGTDGTRGKVVAIEAVDRFTATVKVGKPGGMRVPFSAKREASLAASPSWR